MRSRFFAAIACLCLAPCALYAAPYSIIATSAGTGFFIDRNGALITNAHIVRQCQSINVLTKAGERPATLTAIDSEHDLALLQVKDMGGSLAAPLRWNISDLKIGDPVYVIGFPGSAGVEGQYTFKNTEVASFQGPLGEPVLIQLGGVVQKGNSGGPVLDGTGNVIAVVTGMALTYATDESGVVQPKLIRQSDVAIPLAPLQDFLKKNAVTYYELASGNGSYSADILTRNALQFTVPVRCVQGVIAN